MDQSDALKEYINKSELREFSEKIKVRLSKELAEKYDNDCYTNFLSSIQKCLDMIDTLNICYPNNLKPILYVYIVPDTNYCELLRIPKQFDRGKGGGKPVPCYDLDGFNSAFGLTQNMLENYPKEETRISIIENTIHELSHIAHGQFFSKNQTIDEGFAETLPLYILNLEDIFDEHRNAIIELNESQILTAQELLQSERNGNYGAEAVLPNKSCSFRFSYISSYLLVRGCIEAICENKSFSKAQAIQNFLEIVNESNHSNEFLIYDIANAIGIPKDDLLNGKSIQMNTLTSFSTVSQKNKIH